VFGGSREIVPTGMSWNTIPVTIITPLSEVDDMLFWVVKMILDDKEVCAEESKQVTVNGTLCEVNITELVCEVEDSATSLDAMLHVLTDPPRSLAVYLVSSNGTVFGGIWRVVPSGMSWLNIPVALLYSLENENVMYWHIELKDLNSKTSCANVTKEVIVTGAIGPFPTPEITECVLLFTRKPRNQQQ
jgi:hypothetical protein